MADLAIDITTTLTGADAATAKIEGLSAALTASDARVKAAQAALSGASKQYDFLGNAVAAAAKKVEASRELGVIDGRAMRELQAAEAAVNAFAPAVDRLAANLNEAKAAQAGYKQQIVTSMAAQKLLAQQIEATEKAAKAQAAATAKAAQQQAQALSLASSRVSKLRGALGDSGGALGRLGQKALAPVQAFHELREVFSGTTAAMVVGIGVFAATAVAVVALTAAFAALGTATLAAGIGLADTRREAALSAEAFAAMHPAVAGVDFAGITRDTNLSAEALQGLATKLEGAKVAASEMPAALRAAALAEKALGVGGADKFIEQIKDGRLSVKRFADTAQESFGGIVQRRLLGLGDAAITLKRNLAGIFGGLEIEGALTAISKFVGMLSESHVVGRTIKFFFETIFQPFVDSIEGAYYAVEAFVLGFLIGMTKIFIGVKPVIAAVAEFLGFDDATTQTTLESLTAAGELLAPVILTALTVFALFAAGVLAAGAAIVAVPLLFVAAVAGIMSAIQSALDWIGGIDMGQVASDLWAGFVDGIVNFGPNVVSAITGVVGGAIDSAKALLGIASPSKVFAQIGENTGEGFAMGLEDTEAAAQGALATMVEPPSTSEGATAKAGANAAQSAGAGVSLEGVTFNFYGVEGAEEAQDRLAEAWTRLLEGDAASLGAA